MTTLYARHSIAHRKISESLLSTESNANLLHVRHCMTAAAADADVAVLTFFLSSVPIWMQTKQQRVKNNKKKKRRMELFNNLKVIQPILFFC